MIGSIRGKIIKKTDHLVIVDVGGVGYKTSVPNNILNTVTLNSELFLWTHTVVKENALDLYGFQNEEELQLFEMLITISGIGPKSALSILNLTTIESLSDAISTGDTSHLTKVSGIGKKIAEKIILELKGKFVIMREPPAHLKEEIDTIEALKALGYSQKEAQETMKKVSSGAHTTNEKLKEALRILNS